VITEGIPETVQLSADRFNVLLSCRSTVLWIVDELRPRFWCVTEAGQIEWHWLSSFFENSAVSIGHRWVGLEDYSVCFGRSNLTSRLKKQYILTFPLGGVHRGMRGDDR